VGDNYPLSHSNEVGHSMVEILAAMVLMSLIAGSLLTAHGVVAAWLDCSWRETAANSYAVSIAECLRSQRHLLEESNSGCSAEELDLPCFLPDSGMEGRVTWIRPHPDNPRIYEVGITVSWEQRGAYRDVHLDTLIRQE